MKNHFSLIILKILVLILFFEIGKSCSCFITDSQLEDFRRHNSVFTGKVLEIIKINSTTLSVKFQANRIFKGVNSRFITVRTPSSSVMCGYRFIVGNNYLVYAYLSQNYLWVNLCSRTNLVQNAQKDLIMLTG